MSNFGDFLNKPALTFGQLLKEIFPKENFDSFEAVAEAVHKGQWPHYNDATTLYLLQDKIETLLEAMDPLDPDQRKVLEAAVSVEEHTDINWLFSSYGGHYRHYTWEKDRRSTIKYCPSTTLEDIRKKLKETEKTIKLGGKPGTPEKVVLAERHRRAPSRVIANSVALNL